jgi:hypothetical protein
MVLLLLLLLLWSPLLQHSELKTDTHTIAAAF